MAWWSLRHPIRKCWGVLTERDIVLALHEEDQAVPETKISEVMTRGVWTCTPEDRLANITQVMTKNKICHLPVAKDGKVVDIISASNFLKLIPSGI